MTPIVTFLLFVLSLFVLLVLALSYACLSLVDALDKARELKDAYLKRAAGMARSREFWRAKAIRWETIFCEDLGFEAPAAWPDDPLPDALDQPRLS